MATSTGGAAGGAISSAARSHCRSIATRLAPNVLPPANATEICPGAVAEQMGARDDDPASVVLVDQRPRTEVLPGLIPVDDPRHRRMRRSAHRTGARRHIAREPCRRADSVSKSAFPDGEESESSTLAPTPTQREPITIERRSGQIGRLGQPVGKLGNRVDPTADPLGHRHRLGAKRRPAAEVLGRSRSLGPRAAATADAPAPRQPGSASRSRSRPDAA